MMMGIIPRAGLGLNAGGTLSYTTQTAFSRTVYEQTGWRNQTSTKIENLLYIVLD